MSSNSHNYTGQPNARLGWLWLVPVAVALLVLLPLVVIVYSWSAAQTDVWQHLIATQLGSLLGNTAFLLVGVGTGVTVLGVSLAWLTTTCEFPGRRWLDWALMLPLAIPAYVLAFVILGQWDFLGPVQIGLRGIFGTDFAIEVRNRWTVLLVLIAVLYPYVYMLSRSAFLAQGSDTLEVARSLGLGPWQAFFKVCLPMARPAIVAGVSLALMETLADFGAVSVFNFDTFTTAIYKAWFGLFNLQAAAQLASLLLLFVAMALVGERYGRGSKSFVQSGRPQHHFRFVLKGAKKYLVASYCIGVFLCAFVAPVVQLLLWSSEVYKVELSGRYAELLANTVVLGVVASTLIVFSALMIANAARQSGSLGMRFIQNLSTLGYALPGSVLAVGIVVGFAWFDELINALLNTTGKQWFMGSLAGLLVAYLVRFMAVAYGPVDSSIARIKPSVIESARILGASQWQLVTRIYLPIIRPGVLTAALLVLVDVLKEMPATLLMRPFGWDTLAVRVYEMTSEGEWERAALPAITIVLAGLIPVILTLRRTARGEAIN